MASPEAKALVNLAAQLSTGCGNNPTTSTNLLVWQDEEECDFSSFPSLSLEESPGNYHTGNFANRGDVESHVESLLSRPILLGKQEDEGLTDPESDSLDEYFVERLEEVPSLMMTNFCGSFSTLMNSRLRAYARFLARHGLSLAKSSKTDQELGGVVGIEHKLETMLNIGSQVSLSAESSKLTIDPEKLLQEVPKDEEDDTVRLSLPLKMHITLDIALPHVKETDGDEHMQVSIETTGVVTGIFAKQDKSSSFLRVAEVSLNMHELLTATAEQASKVISCIVDMTNATFKVPLPHVSKAAHAASMFCPNAFQNLHNNSKKRKVVEVEGDDEIVSLSPERCATIVDCVIGELDDTLLTPKTAKKLKVLQHPTQAIMS